MKIDEALDILQRAREAISDIRLAAEVAAVMADIESKSPTMITEDYETWPEEGLMVLVKRPQETFVAEKATILGRKSWINGKIYWTFSTGNKWQYLPEWEG